METIPYIVETSSTYYNHLDMNEVVFLYSDGTLKVISTKVSTGRTKITYPDKRQTENYIENVSMGNSTIVD